MPEPVHAAAVHPLAAPAGLHEALDATHALYADDPAMSARVYSYITTTFPAAMAAASAAKTANEERRQRLEDESQRFTVGFLEANRYYYLPHPEMFVVYRNAHFSACSEDDIQHQVLSQISSGKALRPWKRKVTKSVIKTIRERTPLTVIPDSDTIQAVLDRLVPSHFASRDEAKYFTTVIGDCVSGREQSRGLVFLVPAGLRDLVRALGVEIFAHTGQSSALNALKYKHHEHEYSTCRVLPGKEARAPSDARLAIVRSSLDFLCVASHYSTRFGGSDGYIRQHCNMPYVGRRALRLADLTPETLVEEFVRAYVQPCQHRFIGRNSMMFIWKRYLAENHLPSVLFHKTLLHLLRAKVPYSEETERFEGFTSPHVPKVAAFLEFWETTIVEDAYAQDEELEVDELQTMFKIWAKARGAPGSSPDASFVELITHFYPDADIEDGRVIANTRCTMWDKQGSVANVLRCYLLDCQVQTETPTLSGAYEFHVASANANANMTASKAFFERCARDQLGTRVDKIGVITPAGASESDPV